MTTKKVTKTSKKLESKKEVYQFKISLRYSDPNIWRRIQVPADYTFWELYCAINDAMCWAGYHLHGFRFVNKINNYRAITIAVPYQDDDEYLNENVDERTAKIRDYFGKISKQCVYEYDFGDGWEHIVALEKIIPVEPKEKYPKIIAGANACPFEDCGGIEGYYEKLEILKNPKNHEYEEIREWLELEDEDYFDPTTFYLDDIFFCDPKEELKLMEENL